MAPPTRLRPHLDDLLQKNLELEHVVADLRYQLTQSVAKWADERKMLAVGCDSLMASFAKFRARLDVQPSDWGEDSEGEVEQNLDAGGQREEAGEVDSGMLETRTDQISSVTEDLHQRCRTLAAELHAKEEELEESGRKREAVEEELQRVQRLLSTQNDQLRTALASSKADTSNKASPGSTPDDTSTQANSSRTGRESTLEKLDLANQEINRLKQLLQEWKKYGSEWKRDGQIARGRASELQRREDELSAQVEAAEDKTAIQDAEIQRLTSELADQTAAAEQQRTTCQESAKRVQDLEAVVTRLRAQLSPEQLVSFDSEQNQAEQNQAEQNQAEPRPSSSQSPTPQTEINANKRSDPIFLKIPYRGQKKFFRKSSAESNAPQIEQQNATSSAQQLPAAQSIRVSPAPQSSNPPGFDSTEFEVCIHTCNTFPCRNDSQSFLWPRRQPSLPRHVLSTKKHHLCSPRCPGYRFLNMPLADAMREPRKAKCRPPTEAEVALAAAEDASRMPPSQRTSEKEAGFEGVSGKTGPGEIEEVNEPEGGSAREEEEQERRDERPSPRIGGLSAILGKRLRSRVTDEESQRAKKLRPRTSMNTKP